MPHSQTRTQEINGLWTAEFASSEGMYGTGVITIHDGEMLGGDSLYFYSGEVKLTKQGIAAQMAIRPHVVGAPSIFGTVGARVDLVFEGRLEGRTIIARGIAKQHPEKNFVIKLTKKVDVA